MIQKWPMLEILPYMLETKDAKLEETRKMPLRVSSTGVSVRLTYPPVRFSVYFVRI